MAKIIFEIEEDEIKFSHKCEGEDDAILLLILLQQLKTGGLYYEALSHMSPEAEMMIEGMFWGEEPPCVDLSEDVLDEED